MTKYYSGDGGVFYDQRNDEIILIRRSRTSEFYMSIRTGKEIAKLYDIECGRFSHRKIALQAMTNKIVRIGKF